MRNIMILAGGASSLAFASVAVAQDAPSAASSADTTTPEQDAGPAGGLEEIVVTARRSAETLQSVPVAVTALSGDFLDRQNVKDASALPALAPNLTVAQSPSNMGAAAVFIRGIGNFEPSSVSEQGVGIYYDGVYLARSTAALFDAVDLERVEVLRGPQGTTFGRNTIGGAIQFISRKPANDFGISGKAGFGRYDEWFVRGRVDTGYIAGSPVKASFAGQHREANGYVNNLLTASSLDPGSINSEAFQVAIQGDFGDVTINYNFDYNDRRGAPGFFQLIAARPDVIDYFSQSANLGGSSFLVDSGRRQNILQESFPDRDGVERYTAHLRQIGHALTVAYEALPELTFKSITGYRDLTQDATLQLSGNGPLKGWVVDFLSPTLLSVQTVRPYNGNNAPQKQHQFSQELQVLGSSGSFSYLAGIYYFHERASENNRQSLTVVTPLSGLAALNPALAGVADAIMALNPDLQLTNDSLVGLNAAPVQAFSGTSESMAAFAQLSWRPATFDHDLELTGGVRYTADQKTIVLGGDLGEVPGRVNYDNVSMLLSASYRFDRDVLGYARISTGYRSGGINPRVSTPIINSFLPEKATVYEIGIKSEFFDRHFRVNLAGYLTRYSDLQVPQFAAGSGGATTLIVNAGKVDLKGFEVELMAAPADGLIFDGSFGYISMDYKQFLFRDPTSNALVDVADLARPVYTPKWSIHLGGEYSLQIGDSRLRLRVDYSYRSTIYFNALDSTTPFNQEMRSRPDENLRARLSLEDVEIGGAEVSVGLWGDNLTNQRNISYSIDFGALGFAGAIYKRPVSFGFDVAMNF